MIIDKPQENHISLLRQLWKQAFGDTDDFLDGFFRTGFSRDRCRCLHVDGKPAATLYWFDCSWQNKKLAYIYAVATDAAFQGQGFCRRLMDDTHRHLQALGYSGAVLVPGAPSLIAMYEKFGYHGFCPTKTTTVWAKGSAASLQQIDAVTFETLRRNYLPENAVLQEKETTAFLATFCNFYAGEDFLLCCAKEESTLHVQEFLGNPEKLPGILTALQAKEAVLRLPGGNTPFAMYCNLNSSTDIPDYFGIALN